MRVPPVVKWPGSKRKVAPAIAALFPPGNRYLEPFVGGGALLPFRPTRNAVAGDVIEELIALWRQVQHDPESVAEAYRHRWNRLQREGHTAYYAIRQSFNTSRSALDLLFLSRTCVNGLIRFNSRGEFNNSLHHTRRGIHPDRLDRILREWSILLEGVQFRAGDYRETLASSRRGDVAFLDPPYAGTRGRYRTGAFDFPTFWEELERLTAVGAKWVLTLDGRAGDREYDVNIPTNLWVTALTMKTGHSPFTRLMNKSLDTVRESVYLNFQPSSEQLSKCSQFVGEPVAVGNEDVQRSDSQDDEPF